MGKLTKKKSDIPWILLYKMQDDFETKGLLTAGMAGRIRTRNCSTPMLRRQDGDAYGKETIRFNENSIVVTLPY